MSLAIYFKLKSMTSTNYEETIARLEKAGQGSPKGRIYHASFGSKDDLHVMDIWDSKENFEKFGQTLLPILNQLGVDPGTPDIKEVYNIIEG
jgi:hypothetical protein